MRSPDEVARWIEQQVRGATGNEKAADFTDSFTVWYSVACQADTIVTGVGTELTITAAVVAGSDCSGGTDCGDGQPALPTATRSAGRLRSAAER